MSFVVIVFQALFLVLPAYIANMMPVIFDRMAVLKSLAVPIDFGRKMGSETIFGSHKTYRGFVAGMIGGVITAGLQMALYIFVPSVRWIFLFSYDGIFIVGWGFLLGLGALSGDLVKSFFKRRLRIASGAVFFPFDQIDFLVGALLFGMCYFFPSFSHLVVLFFLTPLLHFLVNVLGYFLGMKKVWW